MSLILICLLLYILSILFLLKNNINGYWRDSNNKLHYIEGDMLDFSKTIKTYRKSVKTNDNTGIIFNRMIRWTSGDVWLKQGII